jgi:hypothetical protein
MSQFTFLVLSAVLLGSEVQLTTRDGQAVTGQLDELSTDGASIRVASDIQRIARDRISRIDFVQPSLRTARKKVAIELTDGSRLAADSLTVRGETASLVGGPSTSPELPTRSIRFVRLSGTDDSLNPMWTEILSHHANGDVLVLRRPGNVLDYLEGVIGDVSGETVKFQFDGEWIDVRLAKLDGWIYFQANPLPTPAAVVRVTLVDNSVIHVESIQARDGAIEILSTNRTPLTVSLSSLRSLEFSSQNTVYLSDLEPESILWTPMYPSAVVTDDLLALNLPRKDQRLNGGKLEILAEPKRRTRRRFEKGLSMHSGTELTYRLAGEYRTFQAIAGIDLEFLAAGDLQLTILGDGVPLASQRVKGGEPPVALQLSLSGVQRLKVLVDYGDNSDFGDHLNLCDVRLVK